MKKNIILIFLYILSGLSGFSQVIIDKKFESTTLENKMSIFRDSTNSLTIDDFLNNNTKNKFIFKNIEYASPNIGSDTNNHWITFHIQNNTLIDKTLYLQIGDPHIDYLNIYIVNDKKISEKATFEYHSKVKKGFISYLARPSIQIKLAPNTTKQVFIRTKNTTGSLIISMTLSSEEAFYKATIYEQNLYNIFFGMILAISGLSIIFYIITKSKIYLYYGLYTLLLNIGFQGVIGNLYNISSFRSDILNGDLSFKFYAFFALIFNVLFLAKLFGITQKNTFYNVFSKVIIAMCLISILILTLNLRYVYYKVLNGLISPYNLFFATSLVTIFYNFKRRRKTLWLYLISFLPIIIILFIRVVSFAGIIETPIKFSHFVLPSLTFEFLVLLVGLSKNFIDNINEKNALEAKIITSQIETQETERKHIAQDLHDDLGATLSALKRRNKQEAFSEETQNLLNKAITDLRAISRRLLPADFEMFGFIPSVEKYIADINKQQNIKVTFIVFGKIVNLNTEKELNIYRIITELVNNSTKYSNGQNATVQLIYHENYLFVSVEDDGTIENKDVNNLGIGLKNVISRLEYLNAKQIETGGQINYSFIFEIPYKPNL